MQEKENKIHIYAKEHFLRTKAWELMEIIGQKEQEKETNLRSHL